MQISVAQCAHIQPAAVPCAASTGRGPNDDLQPGLHYGRLVTARGTALWSAPSEDVISVLAPQLVHCGRVPLQISAYPEATARDTSVSRPRLKQTFV
ncbi:hypothetical protein NDU88_007860 [Pleurodeles waltl]|uniref:Uncharacterized protein n=1 Tax=Pleurodeles waltl TaxID=8319 RepID=A0AAV7SU13_PLEWA|nr:hypothetical protein NDU88_007860 [Pleurodeles waltl]